ncbi:MAG TPA: tetratricopeptide repeat protein [Caldithrix abyssi]|uniref:Tetratricopeptide repeat protein n=1 Tax=Caldithrix abyssi TaxID=187145 RepID=A0A7V5H386_CALAY|nr:tetratricopeptide repeat protein [Caldisericaceae bacterium]HHE55049.1 tetratricopeptide repeat protein [Caldithrix abyssi]
MIRLKSCFKTGLLLILLVAMGQAQPQEVEHLFRQGNTAFQQGNYQQAIEFYQKILDAGYESGELYYNLGNAYFKTNQLGKARLFYERAQRLMPDDEALKENLLILQSRLIDKIKKPPRFFLSVWLESLLKAFSLNVLAWLLIAFFWLTVLSLAFYLYWKKQRKQERGKPLVLLSLLLLLFSGVLFTDKAYRFENEKYGVILKPTVTVFSEPRDQSTEIFVIHEGTKVMILRTSHEWFEIKLEDGKTGWVPQNTLEII